jgi:hypothetical protein
MKELLPLNAEGQLSVDRGRQQAARAGRSAASAEDLLLALCHAGTVAANALEVADVDATKVRAALDFITSGAPHVELGSEERTILFASEEAFLLGDGEVGSEHLLLGVVRQSNGIAAGVLESLDLSLERARAAVRRVHGEDIDLDGLRRPEPSGGMLVAPSVSPDEAERLGEFIVGLDESPLRRVVPIGQTSVSAGIAVELIALEIRDRGAILYWKACFDDDLMLGMPTFEVKDDVGTQYEDFPRNAGGSDRLWQGDTAIHPAPPPRATRMRIEIERFAAGGWTPPMPPKETGAIQGLWRFDIAVADGSDHV